MRQIRNQAAAVAAVAALGVLASCSSDDQPAESDSQAEIDPSATDGGSTMSTTPDPDYTILGESYLVGPGRWALPAVGDPEAPLAVIDVSADYQGRDGFVWLNVDAGFGQVLYRAPTRVFVDPCDVDRPSRQLGPTVDDLAEALAEQKRTTTTPPVPATLGGYSGLYLELSSSEGVDFEACGGPRTGARWPSSRPAPAARDFRRTSDRAILDPRHRGPTRRRLRVHHERRRQPVRQTRHRGGRGGRLRRGSARIAQVMTPGPASSTVVGPRHCAAYDCQAEE